MPKASSSTTSSKTSSSAQTAHDNSLKDHKGYSIIRTIYLYLVALVGIVVFVFGAVGTINLTLKHYVFDVKENYYYALTPGSHPCNQSYTDPTEPTRKITPSAEEVEICKQEYEKQQEQTRKNDLGRELSLAIAQIAIGLPLWIFHWIIIQKEYRRRKKLA